MAVRPMQMPSRGHHGRRTDRTDAGVCLVKEVIAKAVAPDAAMSMPNMCCRT
jgi:hypothetical protein